MATSLMSLVETPIRISFEELEDIPDETEFRTTSAGMTIIAERPLTRSDVTKIVAFFGKRNWSARLSDNSDRMHYIPINPEFEQKFCSNCLKPHRCGKELMGNYCSTECISNCRIPGITCN